MQNNDNLQAGLKLWETRRDFPRPYPADKIVKGEDEGGCGVTGFCASVPVSGRHIFLPSIQMHNRGNGKGGGIAAVGLDAASLGVSPEMLEEDYLIQVAYLDPGVRREVETRFLTNVFRVEHQAPVPTISDWRDIPGLMVAPPEVWRYFVRVKPEVLQHFIQEHRLYGIPLPQVEDEFVAQNCYRLNQAYYASLGEKKAFVLSQGKNIMILKIVGYAEEAALYYQLLDFKAHIWIAHQRYPTRGRVWHPGGAHPFAALNVALVHNGDFANYFAVSEYLSQRHFYPQFLTDTEVAVLLFDLWHRLYGYPLEYVIEALAPTTERDFDLLPPAKQKIYRQIQAASIHGSPDGPWFFIIARNDTRKGRLELIGITDTSMLRPQVFALQDGEVQITPHGFADRAFPWERLEEVPEQIYERIPRPWPPVENQLTRTLTDLGFGTRFTAEFFDNGRVFHREFVVEQSPPHFDAAPKFKAEGLGLTVRDLTYEVRRYFQRADDEPGVVISRIEPGSRASVAGLKPFEVITHVNDQPVPDVKGFQKLLGAGGDVRLGVRRMSKGRIVRIQMP